ncbi:MAG TPA: arginine--tRNA ligase [Caldilineaceae bacterium]|nr:arginine--tRNA ligase [Caldilineaceae bacterium]
MIKDAIRSLIQSALLAAQTDGSLPRFDLPDIEVLHPKQPEHGDYSCNVAMVAAAAIRKATGEKANPRQIAQAIVDHLPPSEMVGKVELAGPGFINLWLADSWLQNQVLTILEAGERFGDLHRGRGQRWQVEFVSANPVGPLHIGGARNAVLGDSLARTLEAAGYEVQREFYVNDGGNQFELFIETLYARYAQLLGKDVPLPEEGYPGEYILDYARTLIAEHGDRFLHMPREEAIAALRPLGRAIVLHDLEASLQRIGVTFDNWFSEKSLYDAGLVEQALAYLDQRGELIRRDGAVWFTASRYPKNDKDEVVVRSNGAPTYFAGDIAYHYDKFIRRKFDRVVNVWSVDHQGHIPRMAAMMQAFGLDPDRLVILMYDLVKLIRNGQEVKLSKRSGNLVTLDEVVDEVGADAIRFNLLTRSPESTIEFDLDLAVAQSNENPVYYVQYSHARICSILARAREEGFDPEALPAAEDAGLHLLAHPSELALLRKLLELEEQIELAVEKLSPHNFTHYALELARTFNAFYRDCKVVDPAQPQLSNARLLLCRASRIVLAKVLGLMGVSAPVSM